MSKLFIDCPEPYDDCTLCDNLEDCIRQAEFELEAVEEYEKNKRKNGGILDDKRPNT